MSRARNILGGSLGNLVEWYDWYVYSAFSLYFAPRFFPAGDTDAELLNAAAVFAVGFLMRPLGAWLMGIYADRHGRKAGAHALGLPDVRRLAAHRGHARLCDRSASPRRPCSSSRGCSRGSASAASTARARRT